MTEHEKQMEMARWLGNATGILAVILVIVALSGVFPPVATVGLIAAVLTGAVVQRVYRS